MFNRKKEEADLAMADQHITEAQKRIYEAMDRIDLLTSKGDSWEQESKFLSLLVEALELMQQHRRLIVQRLNENP